MKIFFTLDQTGGVDLNDPIGNIMITDGQTLLLIESTYLDSWFDVLMDGFKSLYKKNKITLEIVEEPEMITFEPVLDGFKISYRKQALFFRNLNDFYQSLLIAAKEFLFQLHQDQENSSNLPILTKIHHFIEQSSIQLC